MFTIYGSTKCSYCNHAKALAEKLGIRYDYINVKEDENAMEMFRENGWRTVPQVFFKDESGNDQRIGGYDDMLEFSSKLTA